MQRTFKDLTDMTFGDLRVIERVPSTGKNSKWLCECKCGKRRIVIGTHLRTLKITSCGCMRGKPSMYPVRRRYYKSYLEDLTGKKKGMLRIVEPADPPVQTPYALAAKWWKCECDCKTTVVKTAEYLMSSKRPNCGCVRREASRVNMAKARMKRNTPQITIPAKSKFEATCPWCKKEFDTFGEGWGYIYNGRKYCRWRCLRAAERADEEAQ